MNGFVNGAGVWSGFWDVVGSLVMRMVRSLVGVVGMVWSGAWCMVGGVVWSGGMVWSVEWYGFNTTNRLYLLSCLSVYLVDKII